MTSVTIALISICVFLLVGIACGIWLAIRTRNMQYWLPAYFARKKTERADHLQS